MNNPDRDRIRRRASMLGLRREIHETYPDLAERLEAARESTPASGKTQGQSENEDLNGNDIAS
jgi:hypothetical protein